MQKRALSATLQLLAQMGDVRRNRTGGQSNGAFLRALLRIHPPADHLGSFARRLSCNSFESSTRFYRIGPLLSAILNHMQERIDCQSQGNDQCDKRKLYAYSVVERA